MRIIYILILFSLSGCWRPQPQLEGIDLKQWKDDKYACNGFRFKTLEALSAQTEKLKGLSENDILKLLGRPDQNELYKRNQKFYHYFVEVSAKCDSTKQKARQLSIRFNAVDLAKE